MEKITFEKEEAFHCPEEQGEPLKETGTPTTIQRERELKSQKRELSLFNKEREATVPPI